ncbi:MAG: hypothetical protein CVV32_07845 [Methanomicrobiales archaeon HGW-Methanomicrobiales-3]|jgi:hypothetical protein|nr:MAG: hypothetical protein CVV32_07845 [Methanomicrobiales archaeon HGW-Methanomicrobiales-3]
MKWSGWVFVFLVMLAVLSCPVHADELYPTITDVFFERDGLPWNESVQFTVNCYGYLCKSWDCQRDEADLLARRYSNFTPQLVFSYHATCPSYGCRIYEPYYHAERNFGTTCNVDGVTGGKPFTITNFSQTAVPQGCSDLRQFSKGGGGGMYYNGTPEYDECIAESRRHRDRCYQYIAVCDPAEDPECRNWILDGKNVKATPSYRACMDTVDRERKDCDQYLKKINMADMILWKYGNYNEQPAMRACELRLVIPSDDEYKLSYVPPMQIARMEKEFIPQAVWCRLVELLGGWCE